MATYASIRYNFTPPSATTSSQLGAGAMTLIKSIDSDGSDATISFVNGASDVVLDNTYKTYVFKVIGVHPETDATELHWQGSADTGSNYNVTRTSSSFRAYHDEGDSATSLEYESGEDVAQGTGFISFCAQVGSDADQCGSGELWLFNPSDTTFVKHWMISSNTSNSTDYSIVHHKAGYFNTTSAIDAIQFKFESDEIQGGTFNLYGIA